MDGDLAGLLSASDLLASLPLPVDRDLLALSSRGGEVCLFFCSALEGDVRLRSVLSGCFLSRDLLLSRPLSFAPGSLVLLALSRDSFDGLSADLLRLRRFELALATSVESVLDFTLLAPLGETVFPELLLCSPFLILSASSSDPEL